MYKKKTKCILCILMAICLCGCGKNYDVKEEDVPSIDGYTLLWHDEFNGDALDKTVWGYEARKPGATNHELQAYTVSEDNIFVKDGCLVLKALKEVSVDGKVSYTSGKVTTWNKKEFTYGKVIVRAKVPKGRGLWPAAWMMPVSNSLYGQWPLGGEIDIMEILGQDVRKTYSTIHYGLPHKSSGDSLVLSKEVPDFSEEFHEFCVDWEEGKLTFYVDGVEIYSETKWYTAYYRAVPAKYPAPFDAPFYVILNLAVGGDWPGAPDESTDFENAEYSIDYVRVYQKNK